MRVPIHIRSPVKWATLRQAVLWVGLGLPPLSEQRFEELEGYPQDVDSLDWAGSSELEQKIKNGKYLLVKHLMHGRIVAYGRKSIGSPWGEDPGMGGHTERWWVYFHFENHAAKRCPIPSNFWWLEGILWQPGIVCSRPEKYWFGATSFFEEYIDVVTATKDLERVFLHDELGLSPDNGSARKRGHQPEFDREQFWMLCFLEAQARGDALLQSQASLVSHMSQVLDVVWAKSPGETWLNDRFRELKKVRELAESRGQIADDDEIGA